MAVTVRELSHRTGEILQMVERDRRKLLITSHGRPVAALVPIDEEELLDRALESLVPSDKDVAREISQGRTRSLAEVMRELDL
jgi:prevent-host-death family protein